MSKWYQGKDGWEEGREVIDLGYEGDFVAVRRRVRDGGILYEGTFWNAVTEEKIASYLEVIIDEGTNRWVQNEVLPRHYEIYENTEDGTLYLFIIDHQGYLEFYSTYTDPAELHKELREFHQTGIVPDWEEGLIDSEIWKQLRKCRLNDSFRLVFDSTGTYVRKQNK